MLMIGAELTYVDGSSNKVHSSVLVDRYVGVQFGRRRGYGLQTQMKTFPTAEKAQAYYWNLLRGKMAKGYHVVDAAVLPEPDRSKRFGQDWLDAEWWINTWQTISRRQRFSQRQRAINTPDVMERSPRTAREGALVIGSLVDEDCDSDQLIQGAAACESERFLRPMALSHPNCPGEAHVLAFLSGAPTQRV